MKIAIAGLLVILASMIFFFGMMSAREAWRGHFASTNACGALILFGVSIGSIWFLFEVW